MAILLYPTYSQTIKLPAQRLIISSGSFDHGGKNMILFVVTGWSLDARPAVSQRIRRRII